jgi:hypothetical protein
MKQQMKGMERIKVRFLRLVMTHRMMDRIHTGNIIKEIRILGTKDSAHNSSYTVELDYVTFEMKLIFVR